MSSVPRQDANLTDEARRPSQVRSLFGDALHRFRRDGLSMAALAVLVVVVCLSLAAPLLGAHVLQADPETMRRCPATEPGAEPAARCPEGRIATLQPPSRHFVLGTDDLGRDNLARLLYAGRVSLTVGFLVAAIAVSVGTVAGLLAGYLGGIVDDAVNAVIQFVLCIPTFFLLIILSIVIRPDVFSLALILGLVSWPGTARQVRGVVLSASRRDYVDAARVIGASTNRILFVHILPNVTSVVMVTAGLDVAGAILAESGLSYLGFGVPIPLSSWGNMLSGSQDVFRAAPWLVYPPGLMIFITVLCVYLVADGLRDAFDPRLRG